MAITKKVISSQMFRCTICNCWFELAARQDTDAQVFEHPQNGCADSGVKVRSPYLEVELEVK